MGKYWWTSKTVWTNVVGFAVIALQTFGGVELPADVGPEAVGLILAVANFILRFVTDEPIV